MEVIASINSAINGFVWGVPMLVLLVGGGILLDQNLWCAVPQVWLCHEEHPW